MKINSHAKRALGKLSSGERDLVASALDGAARFGAAELEIARLRLRNIVCKYDERLKRERLATRTRDGTGDATELKALLELVQAAREAVEARLQDPGASDSGD